MNEISRISFFKNILPPLLKIIDFYFPLFFYRLMTSAGGDFTYVP